MSWKDDKNLPPWELPTHVNKWGYLNNPHWGNTPGAAVNYDGREEDEPQVWSLDSNYKNVGSNHYPCGHWHKKSGTPEYDVNLYRVTDPWLSYGAVSSIHFDIKTKKLSPVDYYIGSPGLFGLETIDDKYIVTVEGTGSGARLVVLDRYLNLIYKHAVFNPYDVENRTHLEYYNGILYWTGATSDQFTKIGRISYPSFSRIDRYSPGIVFTGSNGGLFQWDGSSLLWGNSLAYPITGPSYTTYTNTISDNEHASDTYTWGQAGLSPRITRGSRHTLSVGNGTVYFGVSASPDGYIYSYNANTNKWLAWRAPGHYCSNLYYSSIHNKVYSAHGTYDSFKITRHNANTLDGGISATYSNHGGTSSNGGIICGVGNYIAIGTWPYIDPISAVYLLDSDLSFVFRYDFLPEDGNVLCQRLTSYENFLFVGVNNHIYAFELVGNMLVRLDRLYIGATTYGEDVGYASRWLNFMPVRRN